jgi:glycosyltransferase involved in cell wall biosynthesis
LVTVTTPALAARYAPHGRVAVLPNYFPESWLDVEADRSGGIVGWTGTVGTHHDDLPVTRGGVAQAVRETGAKFRVIGNPQLVQRDLSLDDEPDNVPWQDWDAYPEELAKLDVGIAPLGDTAFNRAKSWLKPLEMAAVGVPSVVSPIPSYVALNEATGIGTFAKDRSRDWRRELKALLGDENYRFERSEESRMAASALTVEKNAYRFAEAWANE